MPVNIGYQESSLRDLQPYRECIGERRRRVMRSIRYHDGTVRPDLQGVRRAEAFASGLEFQNFQTKRGATLASMSPVAASLA